MRTEKICLTALGGVASAFGGWALYLGYDGIVISSVFGLLGVLGGYIIGKNNAGEN